MSDRIKKIARLAAGRKETLQIAKQLICDEYDACVSALGPDDPECLVLLGIKNDTCAELEIVCGQVEGLIPAAIAIRDPMKD